VSDCCLMPNEQFVSYFMVITIYIWWDDNEVCPQQSNNSLHVEMLLHSDIYPDCEPTCLYSYSLALCAQQISSNYQFYSLWFDLIGGSNPQSTTLKVTMIAITPLTLVNLSKPNLEQIGILCKASFKKVPLLEIFVTWTCVNWRHAYSENKNWPQGGSV
jgi:hypothetical protein